MSGNSMFQIFLLVCLFLGMWATNKLIDKVGNKGKIKVFKKFKPSLCGFDITCRICHTPADEIIKNDLFSTDTGKAVYDCRCSKCGFIGSLEVNARSVNK